MTTGRRRRRTPAEGQDVASCPCGSAWFELRDEQRPYGSTNGVVALNSAGGVVAYSGTPTCMECGRPWSPGGPKLEVVP
jgi:hypothetical protein